MKTAISIPDEVFEQAEAMAKNTKKSRSQLYSEALKEYLARHGNNEITNAFDKVVSELGDESDEFTQRASAEILVRNDW